MFLDHLPPEASRTINPSPPTDCSLHPLNGRQNLSPAIKDKDAERVLTISFTLLAGAGTSCVAEWAWMKTVMEQRYPLSPGAESGHAWAQVKKLRRPWGLGEDCNPNPLFTLGERPSPVPHTDPPQQHPLSPVWKAGGLGMSSHLSSATVAGRWAAQHKGTGRQPFHPYSRGHARRIGAALPGPQQPEEPTCPQEACLRPAPRQRHCWNTSFSAPPRYQVAPVLGQHTYFRPKGPGAGTGLRGF